jgi:hypothetical protein
MAARKIKRLSDDWRAKIQTAMLINRLNDHVYGRVELSKSQVSAALGLLKKTAPDLSATTLDAGDGLKEALAGIKVTFGS